MIYELLGRIATLIKDFCGILSEECLRLNSSLVYELLDEIIVSAILPFLNLIYLVNKSFFFQDYGYVQTTLTDQLKSYVYEDPVPVKRENIIINSLAKVEFNISLIIVYNNIITRIEFSVKSSRDKLRVFKK